MKTYIILFTLLFSINKAYSFSLDEALMKLEDSKTISADNIADSVTKNIKAEADKQVKGLEKMINNKIKGLEDKINKEVDRVIGGIKDKIVLVNKIIFYAKLAAAIFSLSLLIMLFLIYRAFRKITNLTRLVENVANYKEIEARVAKLEKK